MKHMICRRAQNDTKFIEFFLSSSLTVDKFIYNNNIYRYSVIKAESTDNDKNNVMCVSVSLNWPWPVWVSQRSKIPARAHTTMQEQKITYIAFLYRMFDTCSFLEFNFAGFPEYRIAPFDPHHAAYVSTQNALHVNVINATINFNQCFIDLTFFVSFESSGWTTSRHYIWRRWRLSFGTQRCVRIWMDKFQGDQI